MNCVILGIDKQKNSLEGLTVTALKYNRFARKNGSKRLLQCVKNAESLQKMFRLCNCHTRLHE